LTFFIVHTCRF